MKEYIVITGASSGIGQALSICFANSGSEVLAVGRNEVALQRTKLLAAAGKITIAIADLSEEHELDKIVKYFHKKDRIKYLIHCAATTEPHLPLTSIAWSALEKAININVMAPIFLTQKLAPYFDVKMTRVLFVGSDYVGVDNKLRPHIAGAYGISKSALRVAVEYFRQESNTALIGYLNPGSTNTPMFDAMMLAVVSRQGVFSQSGQPAHPGDVAEFIQAVLERASEQSYTKTNWDYRDEGHRKQVLQHKVAALAIRSAL